MGFHNTALHVSADILDEMRIWVSDCIWQESDEELAEISDEQIVAGICRHYDGGLAQFLSDCA